MKILLLHNPGAGSGGPDGDELAAAFRAAGYRVDYRSTDEESARDAMDPSFERVAIAGGDGTLRKAFLCLAARPRVPVLLLPLGTANNIARSLGVEVAWREIIRSHRQWVPRPFYFGRVEAGGRKDLFFESAGIGLFARLLHVAEEDESRVEDLCDGKGGFKGDHAVAARLAAVEPAVEIVVKTRAESRAERIVWAEAMNIPSIGAHLEVATCERCQTPGAVPLMWAAEGRRQALVTWLEAKSRNDLDAAEPGLSWSAPAESYDLVWPGGLYHVDDEVRKSAGETVLRIARVNEPLPVLRPA